MICVIAVHTFGRRLLKLDDQPRLFYVYSPRWLRPLHSLSTLHLFLCWNVVIFIFNMFVNGAYLELQYFNSTLTEIDERDEERLKERLLQAIAAHRKITRTIRGLDNLCRVYAFSMIATMIPSILMTVIMLADRIRSFDDIVVMGIHVYLLQGLPAFLIVLYGFLGLTVSPARLYDEAYKSKTFLCLNSAVWHPYRPEVYQIALALSNHLEQPNMGVTIWGFAVMTKPLILATFSVMAMMLSLMMELLPTKDPSKILTNSTIPN
ncbi:hypothetical protein Y032_0009g444 [Ancylostoma ceylanicum]|nr:hypothetical protein Y032_0009g444 [Ancylostoma ceylanicum]